MVKHNQSPTPHQQSGKFRAKPLKGTSIELAGFGDESDVKISYTDDKRTRETSTVHSSEILSTAELISAVGQIWYCASRSLARFHPRSSSNYSDIVSQKGNDICLLVENDTIVALDKIDKQCLRVQLNSSRYFPSIVQQSLEFTRMTQKIRYTPCQDTYIQDVFPGNCDDSSGMNWSGEQSLADVGITYDLLNKNRWLPISTSLETMAIIKSSMHKAVVFCPLAGNVGNFSSYPVPKNRSPCIGTSNLSDQLSNGGSANFKTKNLPISPLYSNYLLQVFKNTHLTDGTQANHHQSEADDLGEDGMPQFEGSNIQGEVQSKSSPTVMNKPRPLLAEQQYAVSGALSGIVVSLCLHPVDTIKTILQSCQAGQKSLCYIGQSIITERGLSGLYRGISSNITTSAPISAIYTFTYESVKGSLLPSLAKEHYSVAHCTAGACASIATSFIFTPSDHIKQQMQVNSNYQNCWKAALRIIENGGLLSLYSGWGAVLCRNIPHSIIKFYTYESLKQKFILSELPDNQLRTSQTLLCGGLAGSAAALFSTPFDVVKTRLQTQVCLGRRGATFVPLGEWRHLLGFVPLEMSRTGAMLGVNRCVWDEGVRPSFLLESGGISWASFLLRCREQMPGSARKDQNILNALQQICDHEGVKGLYRGLIPRLVMYMSQGALFFASYEIFQRLLSLDRRHGKPEVLQHKQNSEDDTLLPV
ncbi:hypothetical protein KSS87_022727 [Heliosperma pusillum]|nr:hypothetical protein KSS87_022727 [Heliosperma pusillum]